MALTIHDLKMAILKLFAVAPVHGGHKFNLLGRGSLRGGLETALGITFTKDERALAAQAFEQLKKNGLIRSTLSDLVDPENWCEITVAGRQALERSVLDELDNAFTAINPHLVEIRRGAWAAVASNQPDSLRQAAHSGRELIDQVLKEGAPDTEIIAQSGFTPDPNSKSGITRRMRLKFLMQKQKGSVSDSDMAIVEASCDLVEAIDNKLKAHAHSRSAPTLNDVKDALTAAEGGLRRVLC
jgi:hypothetical protein